MAVIERRVSASGAVGYRVRVRLKGAPEETATFKRRTDAKAWAQRIEVAIREHQYFPKRATRTKTLSEVIDRYTEEVLPGRSKGRKKLEALLARWREELGDYALTEVTPSRIAAVRDRLAGETTKRQGTRSPATVNRYLGALSHAFTVAAREWEWVGANPVRRVARLREPRGRVRALSDRERTRLLEACQKSRDKRLHPLVVLALSTGARQGELLRLRWRDVDLARKVAVLQETKNGDRRPLPLSALAVQALQALGQVRRLDADLVFVARKRRRRLADRAEQPGAGRGVARFPQRAWEAALRRARVDDFRFHDLRHSAASYLAMSGATLAEIAEVLGHRTLAMVKRYSHLTEAHTAGVVERMNERFLASTAAT